MLASKLAEFDEQFADSGAVIRLGRGRRLRKGAQRTDFLCEGVECIHVGVGSGERRRGWTVATAISIGGVTGRYGRCCDAFGG